MEAKKLYFMDCHLAGRIYHDEHKQSEGGIIMDKVIDLAMTKLFLLAEYVCSKCSSVMDEPSASQEVVPTIRFTNEEKTAIKRIKSDACFRSFEREQSQPKIKMVEGELFK